MPHAWNILGLSDYEIKEIDGQNPMRVRARHVLGLAIRRRRQELAWSQERLADEPSWCAARHTTGR
jgi:hypothetical protein